MYRTAQREDIRDVILDGMDILLARFGYRKTTMEDLAQQVGIGKGTIYLHFSSKEELTLSHIDRIVDRLLIELEAIAGSTLSAEERLRKMLMARVLFRFDSVKHYSQSMDDLLSSLRNPLLLRREMYFRKEAQLLQRVLIDGKDRKEFHFPDAGPVAEAMIYATNSLLPFSLSARELGKRSRVEYQARCVANLLLSGVTGTFRKKRPARISRRNK